MFDPTFVSGKRRKARGAPLFNDENIDDFNPLTSTVAFDTLVQDESLSGDVRNDIDVSLPKVVNDRGRVLGHARHVHKSRF